jgi:hypothetical protein
VATPALCVLSDCIFQLVVLHELQERLLQANMAVTSHRQPAQAAACFADLQAKVLGKLKMDIDAAIVTAKDARPIQDR